VAGGLRTSPLPSAEIDGAGRVYVVWQDCRFRTNCRSNDIVMSTSTNGTTWSAVRRVPIDPLTGTKDHFIPGIAVHRATSGAGARLGLTYYFYRHWNCDTSRHGPCRLKVGYIESDDGGATWSSPVRVAEGFRVTWTANTSQGRMVGDYISTSWLGGKAFGAFAVATRAPSPFDEGIYVPTGGLTVAGGGRSSEGETVRSHATQAGPRARIRTP
jgi:hypothetical protein